MKRDGDGRDRRLIGARWALAFALLSAASCLWRGYERILTIHLDVLESTAFKMIDKALGGKRLAPNDLTEMIYPLQKARQFVRQNLDRRELESMRRFGELLDAYQALTDQLDAARGDPQRWQGLLGTLPAGRADIAARTEKVRAALRSE